MPEIGDPVVVRYLDERGMPCAAFGALNVELGPDGKATGLVVTGDGSATHIAARDVLGVEYDWDPAEYEEATR